MLKAIIMRHIYLVGFLNGNSMTCLPALNYQLHRKLLMHVALNGLDHLCAKIYNCIVKGASSYLQGSRPTLQSLSTSFEARWRS